MLARRAEDVHASPDAWDAITARLDKPQHSSRRLAALAGAAVAAALVAGVIVVAQNDSPAPPITASTTTSAPQPTARPPHVWEGEPWQDAASVAETYLKVRTGVQVTTADYDLTNVDHGVGRFANGGVATELWLERVGGRWLVTAATSGLVPIFNAHIEGPELVADVTPEMDGALQLGFGGPFEEWEEPQEVEAGESVPVRHVGSGTIRALLRTTDGTIALSEVAPTDTPETAARRFLEEELDLIGTAISLAEFQQGDPTSGEIPYHLDDGGFGGTILMRQGADRVWFVNGITSGGWTVTVTRDRDELVAVIGDIDADVGLFYRTNGNRPSGGLTVRPGRTLRSRAAGITSVQAIARKEGKVVAIAVVPVS